MPSFDSVDYDHGATQYASHRRIHGPVFEQLCERVVPGARQAVLEVGCGTGNYIRALATRSGCAAVGLDPSAGMLAQARAAAGCEPVGWMVGRGERLAFVGEAFDLVYSVDVIHHVSDRATFYREVVRALRPGGWLCTGTDSAEMIRRREILSGYFPDAVEAELARYPRLDQLQSWMAGAGLVDQDVVAVQEPYQITSAQPFRDKAYSSLHLISDRAWHAGLQRLERDLRQGPVRGVSRYACLWGRKL
jgi:SAM-dependent methyltransferase